MSSLREELRALPVLAATSGSFDTKAAPDTPQALFLEWFRAAVAAGEPEPHAMTLSTCDEDGRPDARILLLKDLDDEAWWFATSSASAKATPTASGGGAHVLLATPRQAGSNPWNRAGR